MDAATALLLTTASTQFASGLAEGAGQARAMGFRAAEAASAARRGKIAAAQTDTQLREELAGVLASIRAIRASAGISPDSPTTQAILEEESRVSGRERRIRVGNIMAQVESDERSSRFLRSAARDAWLYGALGGLARGSSTLASGFLFKTKQPMEP